MADKCAAGISDLQGYFGAMGCFLELMATGSSYNSENSESSDSDCSSDISSISSTEHWHASLISKGLGATLWGGGLGATDIQCSWELQAFTFDCYMYMLKTEIDWFLIYDLVLYL